MYVCVCVYMCVCCVWCVCVCVCVLCGVCVCMVCVVCVCVCVLWCVCVCVNVVIVGVSDGYPLLTGLTSSHPYFPYLLADIGEIRCESPLNGIEQLWVLWKSVQWTVCLLWRQWLLSFFFFFIFRSHSHSLLTYYKNSLLNLTSTGNLLIINPSASHKPMPYLRKYSLLP
jgi:hypothetical protein